MTPLIILQQAGQEAGKAFPGFSTALSGWTKAVGLPACGIEESSGLKVEMPGVPLPAALRWVTPEGEAV